MDKENFTIKCFSNSYIGDDAAVLGKQVFSKDIFAENSHFKHGWLSLEEIGYKAMIVNFSDTIVMNARPKFALLGLSLPKNFTPQQIKELSGGISRACEEFGVKIIGIRPGEKMHEVMVGKDDAHLTYEFDDHYVISPSIKFTSKDDDFSTNALGEKGHLVEENFEYSSDKNKIWLDKDGLLEMIEASK